jgi:putative phage-type endonuclease
MLVRSTGIGSSEIAAVVGVSPFQSRHDVWLVKQGLANFKGNLATRMGSRIEDAIAEEYCELMRAEGEPHEIANFQTTFAHPRESWILASPDRLVRGRRRIAEMKNVGFRSMFSWGTEVDAVPDYYRVQVEWQLGVCDALTASGDLDESPMDAHVVAWLGGCDLRVYRIQRSPRLWDAIVEQARDFWFRNVMQKVPPEIDGTDGAKRMVHALAGASWKPLTKATPQQEELMAALREAREQVERATFREQEIETRIKATIGDSEGFLFKGGRTTWKTNKKGIRPFKPEWDKEDK